MVPFQHPIQVVARLTGLNPHVIRVWEKRYGAVTPARTGSNRRMYSEEEVERLTLMARATEAGHKIGLIAKLSVEDLRRLLARVEGNRLEAKQEGGDRGNGSRGEPVPPEDTKAGGADAERDGLVADAVAATKGFRSEELVRVLERGVVRYGHHGVLHRIIHPLAREMGELWQEGIITAAHEHFASALMRDFLLGGARPYALGEGAPRAVVATPAGQHHELGAVMVATAATHLGWRTVYLGPSLPAAEIAGAAIQNRARLVLLSLVYPADDPLIPSELQQLRRYLPPEIGIVVGGRAAPAYRQALEEIRALTPTGLTALCEVLEELRGPRVR